LLGSSEWMSSSQRTRRGGSRVVSWTATRLIAQRLARQLPRAPALVVLSTPLLRISQLVRSKPRIWLETRRSDSGEYGSDFPASVDLRRRKSMALLLAIRQGNGRVKGSGRQRDARGDEDDRYQRGQLPTFAQGVWDPLLLVNIDIKLGWSALADLLPGSTACLGHRPLFLVHLSFGRWS
jgi:hypothetical protein